jgi:hypothetical protein
VRPGKGQGEAVQAENATSIESSSAARGQSQPHPGVKCYHAHSLTGRITSEKARRAQSQSVPTQQPLDVVQQEQDVDMFETLDDDGDV